MILKGAEFFKSINNMNGSRVIWIVSRLEIEGMEYSVLPATTMTVLAGGFLLKNPMLPLGLSSSILISKELFRLDMLHEGLVLDISSKFKMSSETLATLIKLKDQVSIR